MATSDSTPPTGQNGDEQSAESRSAKRDSLFLLAALSDEEGLSRGRARVRNLSETGMLVECELRFRVGERLVANLRGIGDVGARVAWARDNLMGMTFDHAVDPQAARKPVSGSAGSEASHEVPIHVRSAPGLTRFRR